MTEIIDSLGQYTWCEKSPYSLGDYERYQYSWEEFCNTVKHEVRYFFDSLKEADEYSEKIPVPQMLDELRALSRNSTNRPFQAAFLKMTNSVLETAMR